MNTEELIKLTRHIYEGCKPVENALDYMEAEMQRLKSQPKKQWEPVGGAWNVGSDGGIGRSGSTTTCRKFGFERPTKEQAEKARDAMRIFNRLLAYRDEFAPDYEPVWDGKTHNYYVYRRMVTDSKWGVEYNSRWSSPTTVYMPEDVAEELARKLNDGEVVL